MGAAMEIFIFVTMRGKVALTTTEMVVELLGNDIPTLETSLANFDAAKARATDPIDQHALWAVIEASFGTISPFNEVVRKLLKTQPEARSLSRGLLRDSSRGLLELDVV